MGAVVTVPPPRSPERYRISLVCLGNICRSPMAEVVLTERVDAAGLTGRVIVRSAGTGDWHVGNPMDRRAAASLTAAGYDPTRHRAQRFDEAWLADDDLLLAMDRSNLASLLLGLPPGPAPAGSRVRLFRDFDPVDPGGDVPDPYYGGPAGFEEVLTMVERTSATIVAALQRGLRVPGG